MKHQPVNALFCRCGETWGDGECSTACASCHKPVVTEGVKAYRCGECWHAWRWSWQLILHDVRTRWKLSGWQFHGDLVPDPWWRRVLDARPVRPSRIWACPCCSHDL